LLFYPTPSVRNKIIGWTGWNLPDLHPGPRLKSFIKRFLDALSYLNILSIPIAIGMQLAFLPHPSPDTLRFLGQALSLKRRRLCSRKLKTRIHRGLSHNRLAGYQKLRFAKKGIFGEEKIPGRWYFGNKGGKMRMEPGVFSWEGEVWNGTSRKKSSRLEISRSQLCGIGISSSTFQSWVGKVQIKTLEILKSQFPQGSKIVIFYPKRLLRLAKNFNIQFINYLKERVFCSFIATSEKLIGLLITTFMLILNVGR
jgi:hypothetical protein